MLSLSLYNYVYNKISELVLLELLASRVNGSGLLQKRADIRNPGLLASTSIYSPLYLPPYIFDLYAHLHPDLLRIYYFQIR